MSLKIKKVIIFDEFGEPAIDLLKNFNIIAHFKPGLTEQQLIEEVKDYDALIVGLKKITENVINAGKNLKFIGRIGVGYDNVDLNAATKKGIVVINTPGANTTTTAEFTCGMIISLARHIPPSFAKLKSGIWDKKSFVGTELYGKTLGILGVGAIGKAVAIRMQYFGMKTIGYSRTANKEKLAKDNIELIKNLNNLFPECDFITIHTPLTEQTRNMINLDVFKRCKKGVRIINCARGGIINEEDAIFALDQGLCDGIATDVYEQEPPINLKFIQHEKVIGTPHIAGGTNEAFIKMININVEQIVNLNKNQPLKYCVNPDVLLV